MIDSELPRVIKIKAIAQDPYDIEASADERAAIAQRFNLTSIETLTATVGLTPDGSAVAAEGTLLAEWTQNCAVSGNDFPVRYHEKITFRFTPTRTDWRPDEEVELTADDCDELEYEGDAFDLGEAIAQSFGLAIDPYATGPGANKARKATGIQQEGEQDGPLAELLAGLKRD